MDAFTAPAVGLALWMLRSIPDWMLSPAWYPLACLRSRSVVSPVLPVRATAVLARSCGTLHATCHHQLWLMWLPVERVKQAGYRDRTPNQRGSV